MSQAKDNTIESIEQERLRKRKLSEVTSQDSALIRLLGSSLTPYKKWMFFALCVDGDHIRLKRCAPLSAATGDRGPIATGDVSGLIKITLIYGFAAIGLYVFTFGFNWFLQQAGQRALADLRTKLFDQIIRQDWAS